MPLTNIVGDLGSGKTLLVVELASKTKLPVYANFNIKVPNFHELNPEDMISLRDGSFVALDEAYTWLESRVSSGRSLNMYLSYILFLSRKFNMHIYTTDQLLETIDVRFRMMANYEIHCEAIENGFRYRVFKLSRYKKPQVRNLYLNFNYAKNNLFNLYDSYQPVDFMDETIMDKVSRDKTKMIEDIGKIAIDITSEIPAKYCTKRIVDDYCLENKIPAKRADMIFNRIQRMKVKEINNGS